MVRLEVFKMNVLYWLRSDLRLHDNAALRRFQSLAKQGLVLWCPSQSQRRAAEFRRSFLWASVQEMAENLRSLGAWVQVEDRDIREVLPQILAANTFDRIIYSEDTCWEERNDERWIASFGIPCEAFETKSLLLRSALPFPSSQVPEVFTSFRKKVEVNPSMPPPLPSPIWLPGHPMQGVHRGLTSAAIAARITHRHPQIEGGETAGLRRLDKYLWTLDALKKYKETRDGLLDWNDSSKLSPWLAIGALSVRHTYREIQSYERERVRNESTYWLFFELLWREYFHWIAEKWGGRLFTGMRNQVGTKDFKLVIDPWKQGRTNQPLIDAFMNELRTTGWMSNRGRQNVANYLVKTLGGDWRLGAAYFEEQLIDYDPASNWGNWAYQAGVGQDPRDRRFDPQHQASLYDSEGLYVKRWSTGLGRRAPDG